MKRKIVYAVLLSLMMTVLVGCKGCKGGETVSDNDISGNDAVEETVKASYDIPTAWNGKTLEEFVDYLSSESVYEGKAVANPYVSGYAGNQVVPKSETITVGEDGDETTELKVDYVYDVRALDNYSEYSEVAGGNLEEVFAARKAKGDSELEDFLFQFAVEMNDFYPDLDMGRYLYNLSQIKINRDDEALPEGENVYYDYKDNVIYIASTVRPKENTLDIASLRHELGHAMVKLSINNDNSRVDFSFADENGYGAASEEILTTILVSEPFIDRYDGEIAMNLGNPGLMDFYKALLKIVPEIRCEDIIVNRVDYFESRLDELITGTAYKAGDFLRAIDTYNSCLNGAEEDAANATEIIITYLAEAYSVRAINKQMPQEEIDLIKEAFKSELTYVGDPESQWGKMYQKACEVIDGYFISEVKDVSAGDVSESD